MNVSTTSFLIQHSCEGFQKEFFSVMGCGTSAPTQTEVPEEGGVGKESY